MQRIPKLCGKFIYLWIESSQPLPIAAEVVAHSPTPSIVSTAARWNGEE